MVHPRRAWLPLVIAVLCAAAAAPPVARAADPVYDSALTIFQTTVNGTGNEYQHVMLRALRSIGDPRLKPLFEKLAQSQSPVAKIHGFLGLAELDPNKHLSLKQLAEVKNAALQAQIISAALDSDLLTADQAATIISWPDLDPAVNSIVATLLVSQKKLPPEQLPGLRSATQATTTRPSYESARRGFASLLLLQLGDAAGEPAIEAFDQTADPRKDDIRDLLLSTVDRFNFDKAGPWALKVANDPSTPPRLAVLALKIALRYNTPGATDAWLKQFRGTSDLAQRTRLADAVLNVHAPVDPSIPRELSQTNDAYLKQAGVVAAALDAHKGIGEAVAALVALRHPLGTRWAFDYAKKHASPDDARAIYIAIIKALDGPQRGEAQRMDDVIVATQQLFELDAAKAAPLLRPLIGPTPDDDNKRPRLMLLGLLSAKGDGYAVIEGQPAYGTVDVDNLALLLLARSERPMNESQMKDLALMVRGGGVPSEAVRMQAAWAWLKRVAKADAMIQQLTRE